MKICSVKINYHIFHRWIISFNMRIDEILSQYRTNGEDTSCRLSREPCSVATSCNKSMDSLTRRIESINLPTFKWVDNWGHQRSKKKLFPKYRNKIENFHSNRTIISKAKIGRVSRGKPGPWGRPATTFPASLLTRNVRLTIFSVGWRSGCRLNRWTSENIVYFLNYCVIKIF